MLVRSSPFREWVNVYYDPTQINEAKLLKLLRARRCPKAALDRPQAAPLTLMNPAVGPGGIIQLQVSPETALEIQRTELPPEWKLIGPAKQKVAAKATIYLSVQVPADSKHGKFPIRLHPVTGGPLEATAEVVRKVGP